MILVLELIAILLIAVGVFYLSVALGLIFTGVSLLAFTLAWERSKKAARN